MIGTASIEAVPFFVPNDSRLREWAEEGSRARLLFRRFDPSPDLIELL
jgi:hypothetical protein